MKIRRVRQLPRIWSSINYAFQSRTITYGLPNILRMSKPVPKLRRAIVNGDTTKNHNCDYQNQNSGRTESNIPKHKTSYTEATSVHPSPTLCSIPFLQFFIPSEWMGLLPMKHNSASKTCRFASSGNLKLCQCTIMSPSAKQQL